MKQSKEQQLIALKRYFVSKLPDKIKALEQAWQDYLEHPDPEKLQVLYRQTYNLSGSAGTYGFKEISDIAKKIDKLLRGQKHMPAENKEKISNLILHLRKICNKIIIHSP